MDLSKAVIKNKSCLILIFVSGLEEGIELTDSEIMKGDLIVMPHDIIFKEILVKYNSISLMEVLHL